MEVPAPEDYQHYVYRTKGQFRAAVLDFFDRLPSLAKTSRPY